MVLMIREREDLDKLDKKVRRPPQSKELPFPPHDLKQEPKIWWWQWWSDDDNDDNHVHNNDDNYHHDNDDDAGSHGGIDLFIFWPNRPHFEADPTRQGLQFNSHHHLNLWSVRLGFAGGPQLMSDLPILGSGRRLWRDYTPFVGIIYLWYYWC